MKVFLVIKYSRGQDDLAELADTLEKATQEAGHTPFVGWREIRDWRKHLIASYKHIVNTSLCHRDSHSAIFI